jgi:hypothetical protein
MNHVKLLRFVPPTWWQLWNEPRGDHSHLSPIFTFCIASPVVSMPTDDILLLAFFACSTLTCQVCREEAVDGICYKSLVNYQSEAESLNYRIALPKLSSTELRVFVLFFRHFYELTFDRFKSWMTSKMRS